MTKKSFLLSFAAAAALTAWTAAPALADAYLQAGVDDIVCPTDVDPGSITVLDVSVGLPVGIVISNGPGTIACEDVSKGDRVKVKCTDAACAVAEAVKWESRASTESSVASVDCVDRLGFTLTNGVHCDVDSNTAVRIKRKRPKPGQPPLPPFTLTDLFDLYCADATVLGTTRGTVEVKCDGLDVGNSTIDTAKVDAKR